MAETITDLTIDGRFFNALNAQTKQVPRPGVDYPPPHQVLPSLKPEYQGVLALAVMTCQSYADAAPWQTGFQDKFAAAAHAVSELETAIGGNQFEQLCREMSQTEGWAAAAIAHLNSPDFSPSQTPPPTTGAATGATVYPQKS